MYRCMVGNESGYQVGLIFVALVMSPLMFALMKSGFASATSEFHSNEEEGVLRVTF